MKKIILASTSPRRRELLEREGILFDVFPNDYEEDMTLPYPPAKLVEILSMGKAQSVAKNFTREIVLSADTVVAHNNKVYGKPKTKTEAIEFIKTFSGDSHSVFTGFTFIDTENGRTHSETIETIVYFKKLKEKQIRDYVETGEPMDKAGACGIQGYARNFIEKIEGDFDNIVGLPVKTVINRLREYELI